MRINLSNAAKSRRIMIPIGKHDGVVFGFNTFVRGCREDLIPMKIDPVRQSLQLHMRKLRKLIP